MSFVHWRKYNKIVHKDFDTNTVLLETSNGTQFKVSLNRLGEILELACWSINGKGYVSAKVDGKSLRLHRYLLGNPPCQVDHIDRNKLNNKDDNLRLISNYDNMLNRDLMDRKCIGVHSTKVRGKDVWVASLKHDGKKWSAQRNTALEAMLIFDEKITSEFPQRMINIELGAYNIKIAICDLSADVFSKKYPNLFKKYQFTDKGEE